VRSALAPRASARRPRQAVDRKTSIADRPPDKLLRAAWKRESRCSLLAPWQTAAHGLVLSEIFQPPRNLSSVANELLLWTASEHDEGTHGALVSDIFCCPYIMEACLSH